MVVRATVKRVGKMRRVKTQGAQEVSHTLAHTCLFLGKQKPTLAKCHSPPERFPSPSPLPRCVCSKLHEFVISLKKKAWSVEMEPPPHLPCGVKTQYLLLLLCTDLTKCVSHSNRPNSAPLTDRPLEGHVRRSSALIPYDTGGRLQGRLGEGQIKPEWIFLITRLDTETHALPALVHEGSHTSAKTPRR